MSIRTFIANPESYSKAHVVQFSHQAGDVSPAASGMQVSATLNNWGGNWTAEYYTMIPGQYTDFTFFRDTDPVTGNHIRIGKGKRDMHSVCCHTVAVDQGIRFLPWKANTVTYMDLDPAATTFFTGPLSGCSIFIGQTAGGQWSIFHANRNNTPDNTGAIKVAMTTDVITRLPAPIPIVHAAIYGRDYHNFGFVFGRLVRGNWRFYIADTGALPGGGYKTKVSRLR